jgi:hypothetical protein
MGFGPGEYTVALMHNQRGGSYEGIIPGGRGIEGVGGPHRWSGSNHPRAVWRRAGALVAPVEQEQGRHRPSKNWPERVSSPSASMPGSTASVPPNPAIRSSSASSAVSGGTCSRSWPDHARRASGYRLRSRRARDGPEVAAGDVSGGFQAAGCDWGRTSLGR